jgi:hypothetical protein
VSATALSTVARAPAVVLTAADLCDRCGSQAYVYVRLVSGGELLFCAHHARQYGPALREIADAVSDQTGTLALSAKLREI